jgi:hypothetical protein
VTTAGKAERRVFLENAEVPALVIGALRGDRVALRRILGARRGGRVGVALGAAALLLAAPLHAVPLLIAAHLAAAVAIGALTRPVSGVSAREAMRLASWPALPLLLAVAPLQLLWASALPALLAIAGASLALWSGLRRGLD